MGNPGTNGKCGGSGPDHDAVPSPTWEASGGCFEELRREVDDFDSRLEDLADSTLSVCNTKIPIIALS